MSKDTSKNCISRAAMTNLRSHVQHHLNNDVPPSHIRFIVQWCRVSATHGRTWIGQLEDADVDHLNVYYFAELIDKNPSALDSVLKLPADQVSYTTELSRGNADDVVYTTIIVLIDDRDKAAFSSDIGECIHAPTTALHLQPHCVVFYRNRARWFLSPHLLSLDRGKGVGTSFRGCDGDGVV